MSEMDEGMFSCRNICWIVGVLLGLVAFLLVGGLFGIIVGVVLAVAIAFVLQRMFCSSVGAASATTTAGAAAAASPAAVPPSNVSPEAAADKAAAEAKAAEDKAAAEKAAADAEAAKQAAAEKAEADAELAEKAEAEKAAAEAAEAEKVAEAKAEDADEGEGTRPEALSGPHGGQADDLKMIKGVGPKLETMLNELGFYHFDQIAHWSPAEVAWVDQNLKGFKGRVSRDNWVEQAKSLASGAETEFSKRASSSGMYDGEE